MYTDNSNTKGILTASMLQKPPKEFNMRFYWMRDRVRQGHFILVFHKGKTNMADYFKNHHPPWHNKKMRYKYMIHIKNAVIALRTKKCVRVCYFQLWYIQKIYTPEALPTRRHYLNRSIKNRASTKCTTISLTEHNGKQKQYYIDNRCTNYDIIILIRSTYWPSFDLSGIGLKKI